MAETFYAHSTSDPDPRTWQPLREHLEAVSNIAAASADEFGAGDWTELLGLWHDLGKYVPEFQAYLIRVAGPDAHLESEDKAAGPVRGPEHSIAGALHAIARFGDGTGRCLAFAIAGHHAGECGRIFRAYVRIFVF